MALDPYMVCPGGTGKKLKFCCADLAGELEKVSRMLSGSQHLACLDYLDKLEARYPKRACLYAARLDALEALERTDEARTVAEEFLAQHPENPLALLEAGRRVAETQDVKWGVEMVQRAIAADSGVNAAALVSGVKHLAVSLAMGGYPVAAMGHLRLAMAFDPQDRGTIQMWGSMLLDARFPTIVKDEPPLERAPDGVAWKEEFEAATAFISKGHWLKAAEKLTTLTQRVTGASAIWKNLAIIRGFLGDNAGALRAWRRFASLDVPLRDAVDAELRALSFERREQTDDVVCEMAYQYQVRDIDELLLRLAAESRTIHVDPNAQRAEPGDTVRPRAMYVVLDRSRHAADESPTFDHFPRMLGMASVFGKQTDREASVNLVAFEDVAPAARDWLTEVCGDALGPLVEEAVGERVHVLERLMEFNGVVPPTLSLVERRDIDAEHARRTLTQVWPDRRLAALGDRTPREAAAEPSMRNRVLALVLEFELEFVDLPLTEFDSLRKSLGLPASEAIAYDPATGLPLTQLHRTDPSLLSDIDLVNTARRALTSRTMRAGAALADEVLKRESITDEHKLDIVSTAFHLTDDPRLNLRYLDQARDLATRLGQSSATWDLRELVSRVALREVDRIGWLIDHIQAEHGREPGVREALYDVLVQLGAVPAPRDARMEAASAPAELPAAETGKLWTPDSERAPTSKSALWVPGAE